MLLRSNLWLRETLRESRKAHPQIVTQGELDQGQKGSQGSSLQRDCSPGLSGQTPGHRRHGAGHRG